MHHYKSTFLVKLIKLMTNIAATNGSIVLSTLMYSVQDARHPADEAFEAQLTWTVYGLSIRSSPGSLSGYLDTYHLSLTIRNTGVDPLTGLVIQVS